MNQCSIQSTNKNTKLFGEVQMKAPISDVQNSKIVQINIPWERMDRSLANIF
jgi:hypothetical protein